METLAHYVRCLLQVHCSILVIASKMRFRWYALFTPNAGVLKSASSSSNRSLTALVSLSNATPYSVTYAGDTDWSHNPTAVDREVAADGASGSTVAWLGGGGITGVSSLSAGLGRVS